VSILLNFGADAEKNALDMLAKRVTIVIDIGRVLNRNKEIV
jgi:hypothetical protein